MTARLLLLSLLAAVAGWILHDLIGHAPWVPRLSLIMLLALAAWVGYSLGRGSADVDQVLEQARR